MFIDHLYPLLHRLDTCQLDTCPLYKEIKKVLIILNNYHGNHNYYTPLYFLLDSQYQDLNTSNKPVKPIKPVKPVKKLSSQNLC